MEQLLDGGKFFEGVRWRDGHWYASDLYEEHVLKITPDGQAEVVAKIAGQPSGSGWLLDGSMIVSSMLNRQVMRVSGGEVSLHADVGPLVINLINDMVVSPGGHAYVGSFGFDFFGGGQPAPGNIVHVTPDGEASVAAEGLLFPNGMVVSPDGKTLIAAETFGARFTAYDIAEDGSLSGGRVWGQAGTTPSWDTFESMLNLDFAPDGCAIDAEGCIWVADALNNRAVRVNEAGEILDQKNGVEGWGLYSVTLGGADGKTLLACIAPSFGAEERKAANEAVLYTYPVDVPSAFA
ncbi:MAG TPA: SMP-30/gluconolactonase/LRE family protein [Solirubrobacteraceae bacterium]|jgi:sugar lactone lactonase YvrE|nr:SMP-30/gluconolactonase/LRE family protein [Solirubrobacteraceae bacterium]